MVRASAALGYECSWRYTIFKKRARYLQTHYRREGGCAGLLVLAACSAAAAAAWASAPRDLWYSALSGLSWTERLSTAALSGSLGCTAGGSDFGGMVGAGRLVRVVGTTTVSDGESVCGSARERRE